MTNQKMLAKADRLISQKKPSDEWHDFCAEICQIPDNIKHMTWTRHAFAEWLENN